MDSWHDGSFYSAVLTPGRLFDYTIPWNNQKIDVHPPLYYCLIYTAESLFPQLGLPWVGLLPNFVCILAGATVLYCTAKRLIGRFWPAWTAAACWLLCVGVQGMAVFTRMYSLMMMEGIVLLYCHVVLWQALQAGQKPPRAVWPGLFAVTMAGALTQYFFLVFCFFVCGLRCAAAPLVSAILSYLSSRHATPCSSLPYLTPWAAPPPAEVWGVLSA